VPEIKLASPCLDIEVPLIPVSELDLIKSGEMYIKRLNKPVIVSRFIRSYEAAQIGIFKNFGGGLADELPYCMESFVSSQYTYTPKTSRESKKGDIFDW